MAAVSDEEIGALFRRESGRLTSILTRILGPRNLDLAEDVVREAFIAATSEWSRRGVPDNPAAWLLTVARRRAIDAIRRERTRRSFAADLATSLDSEWTLSLTVEEQFGEPWILGDQLRMIFMCCHPGLSVENRVTLILKSLCGFSVPAIARALLASEPAIYKRLHRTRQLLRDATFELPPPEELPAALDTVHTALYLLFNEGFLASSGEPIVREMCRDAMLLTQLLVDESSLADSRTVALLALMCLTTGRFDARLDETADEVPDEAPARSRSSHLVDRAHHDLAPRVVAQEGTPLGEIGRLVDRVGRDHREATDQVLDLGQGAIGLKAPVAHAEHGPAPLERRPAVTQVAGALELLKPRSPRLYRCPNLLRGSVHPGVIAALVDQQVVRHVGAPRSNLRSIPAVLPSLTGGQRGLGHHGIPAPRPGRRAV